MLASLAIEEALRIEPPLASVQRIANADTTIASRSPRVARFDQHRCANHDPHMGAGETFDIFRERPDRHQLRLRIRRLGIHLRRAPASRSIARRPAPERSLRPDQPHHRADLPGCRRRSRGLDGDQTRR